jgi:hypothetical protein
MQRQGDRQKDICKEVREKDVGWINLAQDRDMWQALLNTVMHLNSIEYKYFLIS